MHPREFGKYRIVKLLPLGGMGRVYLAFDSQTNQKVALKLIDHGPDPARMEIVEAERRGAILQARLCGIDSRITPVLGYGDHDGFFYIEMEFIDGHDLAELLAKSTLGVPFAARIGRDICDVLHHAHTFSANIEGHDYHGIVHGDIKPRNIRITPDGQVRVLDFGIAKALSLTRQFTTNHFGSSQYSSPERLNTGEVDVASDLWSVGVVLFEIVTGKPYFAGQNSAKTDHAIRTYSAIYPLPAELPEPFQAILRKALSPSLEYRYPTAEAFASDLTAFLEGRSTVAESESDDIEATRRTERPGNDADEDATKRTFRPIKASLPARKSKAPLTPRQRQVRFFAVLALFTVMGFLVFNELRVYRSGSQLAREIHAETLTDMSAAWTRYEALSKSSLLPFLLSAPRDAIKSRLIASARKVIDEYRKSDAPSVTEADWTQAQAALAKALQIDPSDKEIRSKLYLSEGHLARIRGGARSQVKMLQDARAKFEQSAELSAHSPDPYLGLARLYVYNLRDVDRAEEALKAADKRGHELGRREHSQLADGYRDRGERLMREATRANGSPEEKDLLKRAEDDLHHAEELYRDVIPYGNSTNGLRRVRENLDVVAARRDAMKDSIWPWR